MRTACLYVLLVNASIGLLTVCYGNKPGGSFTIDLDHDTFLKDGQPFKYISGSIHYFRVPYYYWADRLNKMFAAGLDAAQTYVAWNLHEPMPGKYDFAGQQNLSLFLQTAQDAGLLVVLRAGPYICGEWEYGGLPAWLLSDNKPMVVRTMNASYISAVDRWMGVLLPYIKPYLYSNGGPIIMVQVENEYGSYRAVDCGHDYMSHLRDLFRKYLGNDVILFSTDGNDYGLMQCGAIDGVYGTVDFGPDQGVPAAFDAMRKWNPKGPLVNSECYTGWLDYWGGGHAHGSTDQLVGCLKNIHAMNASVNMYMFEGGTSFGFMNGADPTYSVCPTSYDYDSPLTEAGDITDKYLAIRNFTSTYKKLPPVPANTPKYAYGMVPMNKLGSVLDLLHIVGSQPFTSVYPVNVEQANFFYGFVLYRTVLTQNFGSTELQTPGLRDRGYVLVDGFPRGMLFRNGQLSMNIFAKSGQVLDIIVENEGRINYGPDINNNRKGLTSNVTIGGQVLSGWTMYALDFTKVFVDLPDNRLKFRPFSAFSSASLFQLPYQPTVYSGMFTLSSTDPAPGDTYLKMCGWFKGQAYINGFNVGRYWPVVGPQVTLYVPAGVLYAAPKPNIVVLVELDSSPSTFLSSAQRQSNRVQSDDDMVDAIEFVDQPIINSRCFSRSSVEALEPRLAKPCRAR